MKCQKLEDSCKSNCHPKKRRDLEEEEEEEEEEDDEEEEEEVSTSTSPQVEAYESRKYTNKPPLQEDDEDY